MISTVWQVTFRRLSIPAWALEGERVTVTCFPEFPLYSYAFEAAWTELERQRPEIAESKRRWWWLDSWRLLVYTCEEPPGRIWRIRRWWRRRNAV